MNKLQETSCQPLSLAAIRQGSWRRGGLLALLVAAVVSVAAGIWLGRNGLGATDNRQYQAVFLTNGQVYIGKLEEIKDNYLRLDQIYYLRSTGPNVQSSPQQTTANANADLQLIKKGKESYGPSDEMVISRRHFLYYENLQNDGKIVQAINNYNSRKQ